MLKNVMLVDDDDVTLMICKLRLKKCLFCHDVMTYGNGSDAIQYFEEQIKLPAEKQLVPELILLDINMPIMNGWEFLEIFEEKYTRAFPLTKIKILSSSVDPKDEERAKKNTKILGFITKPLTDENLMELMETAAFKNYFQTN
jgi:CheY-like chemotaxis protein